MFELTKAAMEQLNKHFAGKEVSPIRIHMAARCGGPRLALVLDEQKDNDVVYEIGGYTFLIDSSLMDEAKPISVEFHQYMGFDIKSGLKMNFSGCTSCTSCG